MRAIIIGATGATGKELLQILLANENYKQVSIFVRKSTGVKHFKLIEYIINFDDKQSWLHLVQGDVLFSCLGTTLKAAGSKEAQWQVDYLYQYDFAVVAKEQGVSHFVLVSSAYANAQSHFFYSKMKGALEDSIKSLTFDSFTILRPPALIRVGSERIGEIIGVKFLQFFNRLGMLKLMKPMPVKHLANVMAIMGLKSNKGTTILEAKSIWQQRI